jgi:hypothetical protein
MARNQIQNEAHALHNLSATNTHSQKPINQTHILYITSPLTASTQDHLITITAITKSWQPSLPNSKPNSKFSNPKSATKRRKGRETKQKRSRED